MKKSLIFTLIGMIFLLIFIASFFMPEEQMPRLFRGDIRNLAITIVVIISLLPLIIENNLIVKREREKEEKFLEFVRDILESVKSGTPITKAILNVQTRDYGALSIHVRKLANQLTLGFPLSEALENFSKDTKNDLISRTIDLLSESNRSGGNIVEILSSISESINQTQLIKKERKSSVANLQVQGYMIFIIFMIIVLILQFFLIPKLMEVSQTEESSLEITPVKNINFSSIIVSVIVVEAIFSGLVIGKIAEGSIRAGIRHSFVLSSFSLMGFFLAKIFFS
ncbi:MAG: type II secretion system F family protein [Candidatus Pacearchaeota archaeon]